MRKEFIEAKKMIDKFNFSTSEEAKSLVVLAFRNNPTLEEIHGGEEKEIPENVSRIKQREMKEIMKYAVDQINFLLWLKKNREAVYKFLVKLGLSMTNDWDNPKNPWIMYKQLIKKEFKKNED